MKKIVKLVLIFVIVIIVIFFINFIKERVEVKESIINWLGKKVIGKYMGIIIFKEGFFEMEDENIVGGKFIIDMIFIIVIDFEGGMKGKFEGYLKFDDFFGVVEYFIVILVVNNVIKNGSIYIINGNIIIKGII